MTQWIKDFDTYIGFHSDLGYVYKVNVSLYSYSRNGVQKIK